MGGARAIKEACMTLSDGQIWPSAVSLNAQPCPLPYGVVRVNR